MDRDLRDLLSAWLGEEIEASRRDDLMARVREDEAFRLAFVEELRMLGMLKVVNSAEPRLLRLEDELGWSAAERERAESFEERVARRLDDHPRRFGSHGSRGWPGFAVIAASVLLIVGLAAMFARGGRKEAAPGPRPYPKIDVSRGLAMVLRLEDVAWEDDGEPHPAEGDVVAGGRLRFRSGRATMSMLSGVVFVVEGPADVELISLDQVFCHRGKLRARVPKGVEGFLVSGPGSAVLDLGTEFGLNIKPDGTSRGKVFEGEVEAAVLSPAGTLRRSRLVRKGSKEFEIDPGSGNIQVLTKSEDFIGHLNLTAPPLHLAASYARTILAARPRSYWRFESLADGTTPNQVAGGPPLRVNGPIRLAATSQTNRCALFKNGEALQYLEMEGLWEPARSPGYAIELWFLTESIEHATLASLPSPNDPRSHLSLVELTSRNRLTLYRPASVRFLHRRPASIWGGDNLFSNMYYVPYRWHHLVAQVQGDEMEMYLDGLKQFTQPLNGTSSATPCRFLLGRLTTITESPLHPTGWIRGFSGRMDEVALYDRALSTEEVQGHFALAAPGPRP